jgi:histidinol-phosphate aminotransferase
VNNFDIARWVPPHIAALAGYRPVPPVAYAPNVLKLDLNESLVPPSPRVAEAVRSALAHEMALNWYPEPTCAAVREAVSRYVGVTADHVLVTNGSNQAMELIARAFLTCGDAVLVVAPTYGVFRVECLAQAARVTEFCFREVFAPVWDDLLAVAGQAKVVFVANPNNPTGIGFSRAQVIALLERCPATLVVLDEAYAEFHDAPCADLVTRFPNLFVLRSFSKAFALAGLRCGYVLAQPATLEPLTRVFPPWSVNALTQAAAVAALADVAHMQRLVADCQAAKRWLVAELAGRGFTARNTQANFILWHVADPATVTARLAAEHVYVSNKDAVPQLKGWLRVTVGNLTQARQLLATIERAL